MIEFVDLKYAQMLSGRLENFRIRGTNPYKINFRCPRCGDSQKSRSKSRGWLLERDNKFSYYCHNCGASESFQYFLKNTDTMLYNDYVSERFIKKEVKTDKTAERTITKDRFTAPVFKKKDPLKKIKKVSQLKHDHPIKRYINKRQIPTNQHYRLYFTRHFKAWINEIIPDKFDPAKIGKDEPRLVIPFLDEDGKIFGCSARGFDPKGIRYITIMFEDRPKVFGLDTVDFNKPYYVIEGAIDAMFLNNSVAMNGAEGNINHFRNPENAIFVFDAEPRNKEIHKRMEKIINAGYQICLWPENVPGKDINEMVLNGMNNPAGVIRNNTYKGLDAKLKFSQWRKV